MRHDRSCEQSPKDQLWMEAIIVATWTLLKALKVSAKAAECTAYTS